MNQAETYRKFLLNRLTSTQNVVEYIQNCMILENDVAKHGFHKVMIHHWTDGEVLLFEVLSDYFGATIIPVLVTNQNNLTTFYTSSLSFVLKAIKLDLMFPHARNMYNVDILFHDKTSTDCFEEKLTLDDIVNEVICSRFNENFELNLSNFCKDPGFVRRKICFYDLTLLSHFKILMLRMGRDTRYLNLSNNELSQIPLKVINFFIKGELLGVNLSNNNIPSFTELQRISSKIEKLWVEGNPLCGEVDSVTYIKQIVQKFPRLTELDGVKLNEHGIMMPFFKNFLLVPDKKTKMIVEKFISLYFSHYDSSRKKIDMFYDLKAHLTISLPVTVPENGKGYVTQSRNIMNQSNNINNGYKKRVHKRRASILQVFIESNKTIHDLTSFTVDVLKNNNKILIIVIDGVFKDIPKDESPERVMQFRRTFVFEVNMDRNVTYYTIVQEIYSISLAPPEIAKNYFLHPIRNLNQFSLIDPTTEEKDAICSAFMNLTQLKKAEAEARLLYHNWDMRVALKIFVTDLKADKINSEKFYEDDTSDASSLLDDEID